MAASCVQDEHTLSLKSPAVVSAGTRPRKVTSEEDLECAPQNKVASGVGEIVVVDSGYAW